MPVLSSCNDTLDVTDHEQLAQELQRQQAYLAEAQRLSHTGSFGWTVQAGEIVWSDETFQIFEFDPSVKPTLGLILERLHPEDRGRWQQIIDQAPGGQDFKVEYRLLMPDGRVTRSTLESKIRTLKIDKNRFKVSNPS
jgi:PAS domain-containing protein